LISMTSSATARRNGNGRGWRPRSRRRQPAGRRSSQAMPGQVEGWLVGSSSSSRSGRRASFAGPGAKTAYASPPRGGTPARPVQGSRKARLRPGAAAGPRTPALVFLQRAHPRRRRARLGGQSDRGGKTSSWGDVAEAGGAAGGRAGAGVGLFPGRPAAAAASTSPRRWGPIRPDAPPAGAEVQGQAGETAAAGP